MRLARIGVLLSSFLLAAGVDAQGKTGKRYALTGHGTFIVPVPPGWRDDVKQDNKGHPPTISYRIGTRKDAQVMITPIWRARADAPPLSKESLRKNVEAAATAIREQALEKDIPVVEFNGKSGAGYYFEATDKAPKPGEFKFLRQGMLKVGDLLVAFTILSDSRQEPVLRDAMQMLQGAAHTP